MEAVYIILTEFMCIIGRGHAFELVYKNAIIRMWYKSFQSRLEIGERGNGMPVQFSQLDGTILFGSNKTTTREDCRPGRL